MPTEQGNPLEFSSDHPLITFNAPVSHPHMALEHGCEVFVPDLVGHSIAQKNPRAHKLQGADKIWRLVQNGAPGNFKIQGQIDQPQGSGPRHIAARGTRHPETRVFPY